MNLTATTMMMKFYRHDGLKRSWVLKRLSIIGWIKVLMKEKTIILLLTMLTLINLQTSTTKSLKQNAKILTSKTETTCLQKKSSLFLSKTQMSGEYVLIMKKNYKKKSRKLKRRRLNKRRSKLLISKNLKSHFKLMNQDRR